MTPRIGTVFCFIGSLFFSIISSIPDLLGSLHQDDEDEDEDEDDDEDGDIDDGGAD